MCFNQAAIVKLPTVKYCAPVFTLELMCEFHGKAKRATLSNRFTYLFITATLLQFADTNVIANTLLSSGLHKLWLILQSVEQCSPLPLRLSGYRGMK